MHLKSRTHEGFAITLADSPYRVTMTRSTAGLRYFSPRNVENKTFNANSLREAQKTYSAIIRDPQRYWGEGHVATETAPEPVTEEPKHVHRWRQDGTCRCGITKE